MTLSPEKKRARSKGLGGSDIGTMLGLSPWKTPVELWSEKCGHTEPEDISDRDVIRFGHLLEDIVAREFARRQDVKVRRRNKTVTHPKYPFMLANIDREIVGERAGLEVKTASAWLQQHWGEPGSDDIPLYYLTQCVHYMEVLDYDVWYCAVLIGGNEFRWYRVERDANIAASLIEKESEFWRGVLANEPPDPVKFSDMTTLYRRETKAGIVATEHITKLMGELKSVEEEIARRKQAKERLKMEICDFMGNAGRLTDRTGSPMATWLAHDRRTVDSALLKERYPEIYEEVSRVTTVRPFRT